MLNTRRNNCICRYIEHMMSHKREITLRVPLRGYGGVAGEERIAGVPKFHSWGKSSCH